MAAYIMLASEELRWHPDAMKLQTCIRESPEAAAITDMGQFRAMFVDRLDYDVEHLKLIRKRFLLYRKFICSPAYHDGFVIPPRFAEEAMNYCLCFGFASPVLHITTAMELELLDKGLNYTVYSHVNADDAHQFLDNLNNLFTYCQTWEIYDIPVYANPV